MKCSRHQSPVWSFTLKTWQQTQNTVCTSTCGCCMSVCVDQFWSYCSIRTNTVTAMLVSCTVSCDLVAFRLLRSRAVLTIPRLITLMRKPFKRATRPTRVLYINTSKQRTQDEIHTSTEVENEWEETIWTIGSMTTTRIKPTFWNKT